MTPFSDDEYRSLAQFRFTLRQFLAFSERAAGEHGLTAAHHQLLLTVRALELDGGAPSITRIAEHLLLKSHSASELVDRAVDQGLVERRVDSRDGRRSLVVVTATGRTVLEQLSQMHRRELEAFRSETSLLLGTLEPQATDSHQDMHVGGGTDSN